MKHLLCRLLFVLVMVSPAAAAEIDVPQTMEFAGIKLKIKEGARRKIEENAEKLRKGGTYFQAKLDRINLYFPIIEQVLAEEGVPNDFKYLIIQESDLISDAVSTSNAVGYWQFKKETAVEMGLTVNGKVDERKHIVASTRAAAKYLKKNNFFMQNWLYSLLSYNMGVGGCRALVGDKERGADRMEVDNDTHWYILKFLSHRVAFEGVIGQNTSQPITLLEYRGCSGKTLQDIADELELDEAQLTAYNKWLDTRRVPDDKDYTVMVPAPAERFTAIAARLKVPDGPVVAATRSRPSLGSVFEKSSVSNTSTSVDLAEQKKYPGLSGDKRKGSKFYRINGKPGILAQTGDISGKLAQQAGISLDKFLKYNDLQANESLVPGRVYYLKKKKNKAKIHHHIVTENETPWQISQKYGITLASLLRKNRMKKGEKLARGRVVWLRYIRPASTPIEIKSIPRAEQPVMVKKAEGKSPKQPDLAPPTREQATVTLNDHKPVERLPAPGAVKTEGAIKPTPATDESASPIEKRALMEPIIKSPAPVAETPAEPEITTVRTESADENKTRTHQVTAGQSLYSIAKLYAVSVADLRRWNNLSDTEGLKIGQQLSIDGGSDGEGAPRLTATDSAQKPDAPQPDPVIADYVVQPGDTLYKISKKHGITVQQLMNWNGKTSPSVSVGEKLKVKPI